MSIKVIYTKSFGQLIGDIEENLSGELNSSYAITNPCVVQIGRDQVGLVPLLGTVKSNILNLPSSEVISGLYDPVEEIYNYYNSSFGSGIQLITK